MMDNSETFCDSMKVILKCGLQLIIQSNFFMFNEKGYEPMMRAPIDSPIFIFFIYFFIHYTNTKENQRDCLKKKETPVPLLYKTYLIFKVRLTIQKCTLCTKKRYITTSLQFEIFEFYFINI